MARKQEVGQGRLIVSVIHSSMDALADSLTALEKRFGLVQYETIEIECSQAAAYKEEMGDNLQRRFFSFERPVERDALPLVKSVCCKVESQFADRIDDYPFRTVNIDPGILTPSNLVMASHREYNHSVYLEDGVFAIIALIWARDKFTRLPWTNLDFCDGDSIEFFGRVRESFNLLEYSKGSPTSQVR